MFDEEAFHRARKTKTLGERLVILGETGSTNTWIAGRLADADIEKTVALAERQTAGRGRRGGEWISPPFVNIAASLAWPVPDSVTAPGVIALAAGVALGEAVEMVSGLSPKLKYPNDLLLGEKKAAGILVEMKSGAGRRFAVIGAGVNVNTSREMLPEQIRDSATSIAIERGGSVSRERVLALFLGGLERLLDLLDRQGASAVTRIYEQRSGMMGRRVSAPGANGGVEGVAVAIEPDGALVIEDGEGSRARVTAGETRFIY